MSRRALLIAAALAAGCTQNGTGVLLTVAGPGLGVDQLTIRASYDGKVVTHDTPSTPRALTLPTSVTLALPDHATTVSLQVTALAAGTIVGTGETGALMVPAHQVVPASVTLSPGSHPPGVCGQIGLVADDFQGGTMPIPEWNRFVSGGITLAPAGGDLVIGFGGAVRSGANAGYTSRAWYDFTGSTVTIEVPQMVATNVQAYANFAVQRDDKQYVEILQEHGTIFFALGSTDLASAIYDPTAQRWWQLRESAGTVYFEVSPDGTTWRTVVTTPTPAWARQSQLVLGAGADAAVSNAGAVHFRSLNRGAAAGVYCPAHSLTDDFGDGVRGPEWLASYTDHATVTETGGALDIALQPRPSSAEYISSWAYDLTGDSITVEVPAAAQVADGAAMWLHAGVDENAGTGYEIQCDEAQMIYAHKNSINGATVLAQQVYDGTQHRWWRLRESGGTMFYETSGDGRAWIARASEPALFPITAARIQLGVSVYDAAATAPGHVRFAHFNLPPP